MEVKHNNQWNLLNSELKLEGYHLIIFLKMGVEWHYMLGLMSIATSYMLILIIIIL